MKFLAIIEGTIREAFAKKTLLGMFIVSTLMILVALGLFQIDVIQQALTKTFTTHKPNAQQQAVAENFGTVLDFVWTVVTSILMYFSVLVGVFVSAGLLTSVMEKGTIDLMLSKPVPRWQYIVGRFTGGTIIMFAEVAWMLGGLWLVTGISLGVWSGGFLWSIPMVTLGFASAYTVVVLFAVITRSSWFAVIILYAVLIFAGVLLPLAQFLTKLLTGDESNVLAKIIGTLKYTVPHIGSIAAETTNAIRGKSVDAGVIFIALGLMVVYLAAASYAFSRKEF
jgi:ABC-type transport system involved in multi-copper enzyme maturation permease subunit